MEKRFDLNVQNAAGPIRKCVSFSMETENTDHIFWNYFYGKSGSDLKIGSGNKHVWCS